MLIEISQEVKEQSARIDRIIAKGKKIIETEILTHSPKTTLAGLDALRVWLDLIYMLKSEGMNIYDFKTPDVE